MQKLNSLKSIANILLGLIVKSYMETEFAKPENQTIPTFKDDCLSGRITKNSLILQNDC